MLLSDHEIIDRCENQQMIAPFFRECMRTLDKKEAGKIVVDEPVKVLSYGTSSYGYDIRLADEVKIFTNMNAGIIDPKNLNPNCLADATVWSNDKGEKWVILPNNSFLLGRTLEYIRVPRDILVVCLGKSTLARAGAQVIVTPLEPEWEGEVVIEIANLTNSPMRIYLNEGVAQFLFMKGNTECKTSYADRGGRYQGQTGVTLPFA